MLIFREPALKHRRSGLAQSTQQRLCNPQSASPKLLSEKLFFRAEYIWGLLVYPGFSFNSAQFSLGELMGQKKIKMPLHTACPDGLPPRCVSESLNSLAIPLVLSKPLIIVQYLLPGFPPKGDKPRV